MKEKHLKTQEEIDEMENEPKMLMMLKKFNHPNIMSCDTWYKSKDGSSVILLIKYEESITLREFLKKQEQSIDESLISYIFG